MSNLLGGGHSLDFLRKLSFISKSNFNNGNDQDIFNEVVSKNPQIIKSILALPEALFQNGLLYRTHIGPNFSASVGNLSIYLFHANFVSGIDNKINLLRYSGLWFLDC